MDLFGQELSLLLQLTVLIAEGLQLCLLLQICFFRLDALLKLLGYLLFQTEYYLVLERLVVTPLV